MELNEQFRIKLLKKINLRRQFKQHKRTTNYEEMIGMNKNKEIKVNYTITSKALSVEGIRYLFQVYTSQMRRSFRFEQFHELVTIKAYGLKVIISDHGKPDTFYDFGLLTAEAFELAYLAHALARTQLLNFDHLKRAIHSEAAIWGEPVLDVEGKPVYDSETRDIKRDPFIHATRHAAKRIMNTSKRFAELRKDSNKKEKGVR